jgi:hypothetical protein
MVPILTALIGLLWFGACSARAELDLSPSVTSVTVDQMPIRHVVFHDGAREITYQPPNGWTCEGSHNYVELSIPEYAQTRAFIQSEPRLRIPAFDDKAAKLFHDNPGLLQLPRGAKDVKITAVTLNPLVIDSHPTLEVDLTYSFFGQGCAKSILLCNRNGAELSFVLDCPASDFGMLSGKFRRSLFSIENL